LSNDEINDDPSTTVKSGRKVSSIDPRRRKRRRLLVSILCTPLIVAAIISLVFFCRIYASNRMMDDHALFPLIPSPSPPQSLLIFAPHCDDEVLGAGGLMYQATHAGCPVHVVIISNGDGFRIGVSRDFHKIDVQPADFVKYGYMRQDESRTALAVVGVKSPEVTFLGYPDRGLMPMLTTNWSKSTPYRSHYTDFTTSPYSDSPTPNAIYCGEQVLADIENQMEMVKPTDIYITHPSDDHPDHAAASVFVRTALDRLRAKGDPWAQTARLHYYLVHRGDWPLPQGLHEGFPLPPPAHMVGGETQWQSLPLTKYQVMRKYAAIKRYHSQTELTGRFLFSFARKNELFGTVVSGARRPLAVVADGTIGLDPRESGWRGVVPVSIDPAGDDIGRAVQGAADITRTYLARDSKTLYVRLKMRSNISPDVSYGLSLRPLDSSPNPPPYLRYVVKPGPAGQVQYASRPADVQYVWRGSQIIFAIPLGQLPLSTSDANATIDVAADSMFADIYFDRTGYHGVAFNSDPSMSKVASSDRKAR